jgi:hypothetical protein
VIVGLFGWGLFDWRRAGDYFGFAKAVMGLLGRR